MEYDDTMKQAILDITLKCYGGDGEMAVGHSLMLDQSGDTPQLVGVFGCEGHIMAIKLAREFAELVGKTPEQADVILLDTFKSLDQTTLPIAEMVRQTEDVVVKVKALVPADDFAIKAFEQARDLVRSAAERGAEEYGLTLDLSPAPSAESERERLARLLDGIDVNFGTQPN